MRIFGAISLLIWITIAIAVAVMFDWLGSRDLVRAGLENALVAVEQLEKTGDQLQSLISDVKDSGGEAADEAQKATGS
ncbi:MULTISPECIES: hypothetical protein [Thiomicrorhabdus]|uniref:Uncharacterized protein n=1 Tax=Thiomicrorhabdus heinhorstiae TaxID=2748010 RepID=A0ABS0BYT3_9GAMM|nr:MULTISPECIES: hypothetical protein [Thiomicrorhabdus]MBF6058960.1 hypothetical protein [Thiomicrorhabdus heinhorstiae]